jgi:hypothetical protein
MTARKKPKLDRPSLTKAEIEALTVDELVRLKLKDDEKILLKELNDERDMRIADRQSRVLAEQEQLLHELKSADLEIHRVSDLISRSERYPDAIPILLRHLQMPYSDVTKETIARSLAVKEKAVVDAWPMLVKEYLQAPIGLGIKAPGDRKEYRLSAKDGLACALSVAVTEHTIDELIRIVKDRSNGESRILLLSALKKSKNPKAKAALVELAFDPQLEKEISSWSRKKPKPSAH